MAEDKWCSTTADGKGAEYCYNQSNAGAWATRKVGDLTETISPIAAGLRREQVEQEFERRATAR